MHSHRATHTNTAFDYDVRRVVAGPTIAQVGELVLWCGGLLAALVVAALLV